MQRGNKPDVKGVSEVTFEVAASLRRYNGTTHIYQPSYCTLLPRWVTAGSNNILVFNYLLTPIPPGQPFVGRRKCAVVMVNWSHPLRGKENSHFYVKAGPVYQDCLHTELPQSVKGPGSCLIQPAAI